VAGAAGGNALGGQGREAGSESGRRLARRLAAGHPDPGETGEERAGRVRALALLAHARHLLGSERARGDRSRFHAISIEGVAGEGVAGEGHREQLDGEPLQSGADEQPVK